MENKEAKENILENTNATTPIEPVGGLSPNDDYAQKALEELADSRNSFGNILKTGIMSAAAGAKAGEQAASPLSAFLQGTAAGLQIPQMLYQEKLKEIQSSLDAAPFGATHPEIVNSGEGYKHLSGLPTKIALDIVKQIAIDTAKITKTAEEERKTKQEEFKYQASLKMLEEQMKSKQTASAKDHLDLLKSFQSIEEVQDFNNVKPFYDNIKTAGKDAAGDKVLLFSFARLVNPTIRVNEATMDILEPSSVFDKMTLGLWNKVTRGTSLTEDERNLIKNEATKIYLNKKRRYDDVFNNFLEIANKNNYDISFFDDFSSGRKEIKSFVTKEGNIINGYEDNGKIIPISKNKITENISNDEKKENYSKIK